VLLTQTPTAFNISRVSPAPALPQKPNPTTMRSPPNPTAPQDTLRKRPWDTQWLANLSQANIGDPLRFELVGGNFAMGTIRQLRRLGGEVIYVSGEVQRP